MSSLSYLAGDPAESSQSILPNPTTVENHQICRGECNFLSPKAPEIHSQAKGQMKLA